MNSEQYQPALDTLDLMRELKRLLAVHRRADRLICHYLADLADGMVNSPSFLFAYRDVCQLVHAQLGLSFRSIRERIRVGKALRALPLLDAALTSGRLTYSRIREVTRVATPESERLWLGAARRLSMRALEYNVAGASGEPRSRKSAPGPRKSAAHGDAAAPNRMLDQLPTEVAELLTRAMQLARAGCERELTDAEALAAVARSAIAHLSSQRQAPDQLPSAAPSPEVATHRGSPIHSGPPQDGAHDNGLRDDGLRDDGLRDDGLRDEARGDDGLRDEARGDEGRVDNVSGCEPDQKATRKPVVGSSNTHGGLGAAKARDALAGYKRDGDEPRAMGEPLTADEQVLFDLIDSGGSWNLATLYDATSMPLPRLTTALFDLRVHRLVIQGPLGSLATGPRG